MSRSFSKSVVRAIEREQRARAAAVVRHQKEMAKRAAIDAAQQAVEAHDTLVAELASLHRQCSGAIDWVAMAAALPPPQPVSIQGVKEGSARRHHKLFDAIGGRMRDLPSIEASAKADAEWLEAMRRVHEEDSRNHAESTKLAHSILRGEAGAYEHVLQHGDAFAALHERGIRSAFVVHSAVLVECQLRLPPIASLPQETPSLTTTGKLTSRATPRSQINELHQEFACATVLRAAREMIAVLPVDAVLVNVHLPELHSGDLPCISMALERGAATRLNFAAHRAVDLVTALLARMDFKASRRDCGFAPVAPHEPGELSKASPTIRLNELLAKAALLLEDLGEV